jgi:5'-nucleotidase
MAMRVLLTNDDGMEAEGLQALRRVLRDVDGVDLVTIAPDGNRSAIGAGSPTRRPLVVERIDFDDGTHGFATDGTPVDCVRLAALGLVGGDWMPDLVVAGSTTARTSATT